MPCVSLARTSILCTRALVAKISRFTCTPTITTLFVLTMTTFILTIILLVSRFMTMAILFVIPFASTATWLMSLYMTSAQLRSWHTLLRSHGQSCRGVYAGCIGALVPGYYRLYNTSIALNQSTIISTLNVPYINLTGT